MMPPKFRRDFATAFRRPFRWTDFWRILFQGSWMMIYWGRVGEYGGVGGFLARLCFLLMARRRGVELRYSENICGGLVLGHAYAITVNSKAKLMGRIILYKGSTIGDVRSGPRKGVPIVGDKVVVGLNATIVGGIKIGDDVFIAANSFVNFDVPSHSVVIGNPGQIHRKKNAVCDYF